MMGQRGGSQDRLFYSFNLDDHVPRHRSAGWPFRDNLAIELRVTDVGMAVLAQAQRNSSVYDAHEALVGRVALEMHPAGRIDWCGLSLRAGCSVMEAVRNSGRDATVDVRFPAPWLRQANVDSGS